MKIYNKISATLMLGAVALASCSDIDKQDPQSGTYNANQVQETYEAIPSRADAVFNGMFSMMGVPYACYGSGSGRADDFGYISAAISQDMEGADCIGQDNNYNWFSTASELSTRTANYANPYMRYKIPYNQIGICNQLIGTLPEGSNKLAQAKAMRAFAYMNLAPYFAFNASDTTALCIPLLTDGADFTNNPRATVGEVWRYIMSDLSAAKEILETEPTDRGADKTRIDIDVVNGLLARANLYLGNWAEAASCANAARKNYTCATIQEVSTPAFCNMNEHNWMWAIDITDDMMLIGQYPTSASWIGSFSANGYAAATGCYACINQLLYRKISNNDVRKGWWVNEDLYSPLLDGLTWNEVKGQDIATYEYDDKVAFIPYTNVKFGMNDGIGSTQNNNDWPLMRVEEMYLIEAEALARQGKTAEAQTVLKEFAANRDTKYQVDERSLSLLDEIWFQRRVELWGEGFFTFDAKRMSKPIVRFHEGKESNVPDNFKFNIAPDDGWMNMRFSQREIDNNKAIIDNTGGDQPVPGQNGSLRDGVTD